MRHRIEKGRCPVCRNSPVLRSICSACNGIGEAITVHKPGYEIEIYPLTSEAYVKRTYPDEETPVHDRTTVEQAFIGFLRMIELTHASDVQKREMKRSFFAGAWWMLEMASIQMDPDSEPTADDIEYMQRISDELKRFAESVEQGTA